MEYFENQQILVSELPRVEDLAFKPIEKDYQKILYINNAIWFAFLAIGVGVLFFTLDRIWIAYALMGFWALLFVFSIISVRYIVANKAFALRERDISYKTGWIFKRWTTISFNRIQHSEVGRGVLDRVFDLASLQIYSAGSSSSDIKIPGLRIDDANRMKNYILEKTSGADEEE